MLVDLGRNDVGKVRAWMPSSTWRLASPFLLLRSPHPWRLCSCWQSHVCMLPCSCLLLALSICDTFLRMPALRVGSFSAGF